MSKLVVNPVEVAIPELRQQSFNRDHEERLRATERTGDFWHIVGATGQPAFGSGYRPYPSGTSTTYAPPSYRKINGVVHLRGLIEKTSAMSPGEVMWTMPVGYRPAWQVLLNCQSNGALGRVDVATNGQVILQSGNAAWVSLDGLCYAL